MSATLPAALGEHIERMAALAATLEGHMTPREARFLALLASVPTAEGDLLEIGSFKGKSTILLAKSAAFAGAGRVAAVDPLILPSATDPRDGDPATLPGIFRANLRGAGVEQLVDFHQMTSGALAPSWSRPLRLLWIDGDHTWEGARDDFTGFAPHVQPGGIVAIHDVLNRFEGPIRVLCERMLASDRFGACGLVGSIGWGQVARDAAEAERWAAPKARLRSRLLPLIPLMREPAPHPLTGRVRFKLLRARVPHAEVTPADWARMVAHG